MAGRITEALHHVYENAEAYTVLLSWVVIPLGIYAFYSFFRSHGDLFEEELKD